MRIAIIADGRAEHARRWLAYFEDTDDEVVLLSTHPCRRDESRILVRVLPGLFRPGDAFVKSSDQKPAERSAFMEWFVRSGWDARVRPLWNQLNVLDVWRQARAVRRVLADFRPDVVHALRTQNEGYVAALAGVHPWILSTWGQDFVYFRRRYPVHRVLTGPAVRRADAITADCDRDLRIARELGAKETVPQRFFPGNGGIRFAAYPPGPPAAERPRTVLYARGFGPYLRAENLLRAMAIVTRSAGGSDVDFLFLAPRAQMAHYRDRIAHHGLPEERVTIEPFATQERWCAVLQSVAVLVSPSISDGTPNSMLEAMACGAFPVMGDIESVREWITHGENGLLFDPDDPEGLATCLVEAMDDVDRRQRSQEHNLALVRERADYDRLMPLARAFYAEIAGRAEG